MKAVIALASASIMLLTTGWTLYTTPPAHPRRLAGTIVALLGAVFMGLLAYILTA